MNKISPKKLNLIIQKSFVFLKIKKGYTDIHLVPEKEIQRLNKTFRGKDKPTNVLSFQYPSFFPQPKKGKKFLGEIYLCPKYIRDHKENIEFMTIHGLLHLLGFDHVKYSDRMRMERLEKRLRALYERSESTKP